MHGQGNYTSQVGQDPYARPPAFQQRPAPPSATSHYTPLALQPQLIQQGRPSFHVRPGIVAYQHALPSAPHQVPPAPVVSGGMISAQSYLPHPRPPHISTQISHSYSTSEQQPLPWSQNAHQRPLPAPLPGPSVYRLPSSQGHTLERGPSHQPKSHAPRPPLPPYPSSSGLLTSDPSGSSVFPVREYSYQQPMIPALPSPPPPPLPSSPPGVPPLPPPPPPSYIFSKKDGNHSLNGLSHEDNSVLECPPPLQPEEDRSVHENEVPFQYTESGLKVGSADAAVAHSPADSDMDMEGEPNGPTGHFLICCCRLSI